MRPLCGLSEACLLSSYGLPKATLGILARLQTLPRASPQPCPLLGSWQACLFSSYGLPKATLGILPRLQTLPRASPQPCPLLGRLPKATFRHFGPPSKAFRPLAASLWPVRSLPPLFLWASEGNVRHFGSASNAPQSLTAALPSSRQLAGLPLLFLWASEGNVRHFGSASNAPQSLTAALPSSRQLAGLPLLFLWASESDVRHFGPASKASRQPAGLLRPLCGLSEACLLSFYGLPKATLGILARLQTLPGASPQPCPLLGSWLNASIGVKPIQVSLLNPRKLSRFNRQTLEMKRGRRHPGGALTICLQSFKYRKLIADSCCNGTHSCCSIDVCKSHGSFHTINTTNSSG